MSAAGTPRLKPRQSLSARLWLLTTLVVLLSEVAVFLPEVAHEWRSWLVNRMEDASIATFALSTSAGAHLDQAARTQLLHLAAAVSIRLTDPNGRTLELGDPATPSDDTIDLHRPDLPGDVRHALAAILWQEDRLVKLRAESPFLPGTEIELVFHSAALSHAVSAFAGDFVGLSLLIAGVTGGFVYLALLILLVRPMRRITRSIAAFRADPEHTTPFEPADVSILPQDEIAVAGQELAAMQRELRAALWRNARLVALGTVFAKASHDLRGILTPALLTAERLQLNADPQVRRAGETLMQAVERATDLVRRSVDYAREGPPPLNLAMQGLARLVDEAAETARLPNATPRLDNAIAAAVQVKADRIQLFRVLVNLFRNAAEAGARTVRVATGEAGTMLAIYIADDGPGLPEMVRANLFRPFVGSLRRGGSGLGMAIARDLMVAHGGGIELVETGPTGTIFLLTLPATTASRGTATAEAVAAGGQCVAPGDARIAPAARADV